MAKLNYVKTRGAVKVRTKSRAAAPIADAEYRRLHEVIYKEIQKQNSGYAAAALRAANIQISNNSSTGQLSSELQYTINELKTAGNESGIPCEIGRINIYEQILPVCLTVSDQPEPIAQRIIQKAGHTVSIKPKNVLFHPFRMLQILVDILLLGKDFGENDAISIIRNIFNLIGQLLSITEVKLDDNCAKILMILYEFSHSAFGVDEAKLMTEVQLRYPEIDATTFCDSIKLLLKYSCINMVDGKVSLAESM